MPTGPESDLMSGWDCFVFQESDCGEQRERTVAANCTFYGKFYGIFYCIFYGIFYDIFYGVFYDILYGMNHQRDSWAACDP